MAAGNIFSTRQTIDSGPSNIQQSRASTQTSTVFIEVGDQGAKANITRGGADLAEITVKPEAITSFLDGQRRVLAKVVSQSVAPGTTVARGTVVDVTLSQVDFLPLGVVANVHPGLAQFTVAQANTTFLTADVRDILRRRTNPADLTTSEQATVTAALSAHNVAVTADGPTTLVNAYTGLQAAFQFAG